MASESIFSRFFKKFDTEFNEYIVTMLNRWWFEKLNIKHHTIDFDSSVLTGYGSQEGFEVGYNPCRPGRGFHHLIIAFAAVAKMVVQAWLRTGYSVNSKNLEELLSSVTNTIDKSNIGLIMTDSGFFGKNILAYLEKEELKYIVSAKLYPGLVQKILDSKNWVCNGHAIDICSFWFKLQGWDVPRRFIIVRKLKEKHPKSVGKPLLEEFDSFSKYLFSAFVTSIDLSDAMIWELYRHRAEAKTQIREFKKNYGINEFCFEELWTTGAVFKWVIVAYNHMSQHKISLINSKHYPTLATLKIKCIAIAAYLVRHKRRTTLVLSAIEGRRLYFENLFKKLENITLQMTFQPKKKFLMN